FLHDWAGPFDEPRQWTSKSGKHNFGWRWSRKEIENYLIDPVVVRRALAGNAPDESEYSEGLRKAEEKVAVYEAARTALSNCRRQFRDLPSSWCGRLASFGHKLPTDLGEPSCREGITGAVQAHAATQVASVNDVITRFESVLPECPAGGARRTRALWAFA